MYVKCLQDVADNCRSERVTNNSRRPHSTDYAGSRRMYDLNRAAVKRSDETIGRRSRMLGWCSCGRRAQFQAIPVSGRDVGATG